MRRCRDLKSGPLAAGRVHVRRRRWVFLGPATAPVPVVWIPWVLGGTYRPCGSREASCSLEKTPAQVETGCCGVVSIEAPPGFFGAVSYGHPPQSCLQATAGPDLPWPNLSLPLLCVPLPWRVRAARGRASRSQGGARESGPGVRVRRRLSVHFSERVLRWMDERNDHPVLPISLLPERRAVPGACRVGWPARRNRHARTESGRTGTRSWPGC